MSYDRQQYWESVYQAKKPEQLSWTQQIPSTSLGFIHSFGVGKAAKIIDIGGGDSTLVDHLLDEGFENITVLDISSLALDKARQRLADRSDKVRWVVSDVTTFNPDTTYDIWHDRATFHFLTSGEQVEQYRQVLLLAAPRYVMIGSFSDHGPKMCSGLPVHQYNEESLVSVFQNDFDKIRCITEDHTTPFHTKQNFLFCSFRRRLL